MTGSPPHVMIALNRLGTGGVERVAVRLANGLQARGNKVTFVLFSSGGALEGEVSPDVQLIRFDRSLERGPGLLSAAPRLARLIRGRRPDVLLSPGNHMHLSVLLAHRLAGTGTRLALKMTNPVERASQGRSSNRARRTFFRVAARRADWILVLSSAAADEVRALVPARAARVHVVANPYVDASLLDRPSTERSAREEPPLLLSVGRLTPQKDPLIMIDAVAGLRDRPWRLVMLGEGPLADACSERAAALGIGERVHFEGFVPDPRPWFDRAALFLLSSRYEELPAVLFEALAARCPIVSTAASASVVQALDSGRLGRLVPPGDVAAFRRAVSAALDDLGSGPDARTWLRQFTLEAGVESHARAMGLR